MRRPTPNAILFRSHNFFSGKLPRKCPDLRQGFSDWHSRPFRYRSCFLLNSRAYGARLNKKAFRLHPQETPRYPDVRAALAGWRNRRDACRRTKRTCIQVTGCPFSSEEVALVAAWSDRPSSRAEFGMVVVLA